MQTKPAGIWRSVTVSWPNCRSKNIGGKNPFLSVTIWPQLPLEVMGGRATPDLRSVSRRPRGFQLRNRRDDTARGQKTCGTSESRSGDSACQTNQGSARKCENVPCVISGCLTVISLLVVLTGTQANPLTSEICGMLRTNGLHPLTNESTVDLRRPSRLGPVLKCAVIKNSAMS
jgi:hypothetical protein